MSAPLPPLGLSVVVRDLWGSEAIWWSGDRFPYNRPQNVSFTTLRGNGFGEFSCTLARDIRGDYFDLALLSEVIVVSDDGTILWEGRIASTPRSFDTAQGHQISVTAQGWMQYAAQRTFSEVYVDRDLSKWQPAGTARRIALLANHMPNDPSVVPDAGGSPALEASFDGPWSTSPGLPVAEAWYDAGPGVALGHLFYAAQKGPNTGTGGDWSAKAFLSPNDTATVTDDSVNLLATSGPWTGDLQATTADRRYGLVQFIFSPTAPPGTANANTATYTFDWTMLAAVGTHGLTNRQSIGATTGPAFWLSDIVKDIAQRFCPKLDTSGVDTNTTLIEHWVASSMTPFDAWQDLNKYALWQLSVFENRSLVFRQVDLTDYDWEVRLTDEGTSTSLQGEDAQDLRNGIVVIYDDAATGQSNTLTPDDFADLRDDDPQNPANILGEKRWLDPFTLSVPCTQDMALQFGRMALAQYNAPKEAGTITVQGHIRDRAGHLQQVSKVREGDTVAITDFANARPRLIVETSYSDDSATLSISVDDTSTTLEAVIDRATLGKTAANL